MKVFERIRKIEKLIKPIPHRRVEVSEEQLKAAAERFLQMTDEELNALEEFEGVKLSPAQYRAMAGEWLRSKAIQEAYDAGQQ